VHIYLVIAASLFKVFHRQRVIEICLEQLPCLGFKV